MNDQIKVKHNNQWNIDRALNILDNKDNIDKIAGILKMINEIESGLISADDALEKAVSNGFFTSAERYLRSTQTLLKSFGLIYDKYKLTDISRLFVNGNIEFEEMIFQQTVKKEFGSGNERVHPLVVVILVLMELEKVDNNFAYITEYDYFYYLVNINKYDLIPSCVSKMIEDKKCKKENTEFKRDDFDIWFNLFEKLGILEKVVGNLHSFSETRYVLSEQNMEFINLVGEKYSNISFMSNETGVEMLKEHGSISGGILDIAPTLEISEDVTVREDDEKVLYCFLYLGNSFRTIDRSVFNISNHHGNKSFNVIKKYSLNTSKGKLSIFDNFLRLLFVSRNYSNNTLIKNVLRLCINNSMTGLDNSSTENLVEDCVTGGRNIIYYGIPGCGKSFRTHREAYEIVTESKNVFSTSFHLDYSHSDFVGQIIPTVKDNNVLYEISPGPFTLALSNALLKPNEKTVLIIDEINRGNAAAIFGDLFQLLDRDGDGKSEYYTYNSSILDYLNKNGLNYERVFLPSNLYIFATMNTSDQNVFPLDTAFKRRWTMIKIENEPSCYNDYYIPFSDIKITWGEFLNSLNNHIIESDDLDFISEDKQIGSYFIGEEYLISDYENDIHDCEIKQNMFIDKVVEYIWSDVSKFNKEMWFMEMCGDNANRYPKTFDELRNGIKTKGISFMLKVQLTDENQ